MPTYKKRASTYRSLTLAVDAAGAPAVADLAADMRRATTPAAARALRGEYIHWLIDWAPLTPVAVGEARVPAFDAAIVTMAGVVPTLPAAQRTLWAATLAVS